VTALPLAGRRVLVTRAAHQAGKLSEGLRALGAEPVEVPVLEIQPPADSAPLDRALSLIDSYDWLILTSANTVHAIAWSNLPDKMERVKVAAVGEATAAAARKAGLTVDLIPEKYVGESLVEDLMQQAGQLGALKGHGFSRAGSDPSKTRAIVPEGSLQGLRFLIARAEIARDVIPDALRAAGAAVDVVDAYRNAIPSAAPELLRAALEKGIDVVTFTSSSSVTHLAEAARAAGLAFPFAQVRAISIGPITSKTLRENNWEPAAEANPYDISGLIAATADLLIR
jgi:uroporphyrinogen-III synthase/uroporphyrinogen III methyltransferase/synthase